MIAMPGMLRRLTLQALPGMTLGMLLELLVRQRFRVAPAYFPRLGYLVATGMVNSLFRLFEEWDNGSSIRAMRIEPPPILILGQWRSGTTLLHQLLARHPGFHAPTLYQCLFPHHFAYTQRRGAALFNWLAPRTRPMDQVALSAGVPYEDEFALAALGGISPYLRFLFPQAADDPRMALDLRQLSPEDLAQWRATFRFYLQKLMFTKGRRLVLKSPPHTGRVGVILEMLPGAKFIHLRRDPYTVFASTRKLWRDGVAHSHLQRFPAAAVDELLLSWHLELFELFERDRALIPPGDLVEVRFEELEREPRKCLEEIFDRLGLPDRDRFWSACQEQLAALRGYRKNSYDLSAEERVMVSERWRRMFETYGYPV